MEEPWAFPWGAPGQMDLRVSCGVWLEDMKDLGIEWLRPSGSVLSLCVTVADFCLPLQQMSHPFFLCYQSHNDHELYILWKMSGLIKMVL